MIPYLEIPVYQLGPIPLDPWGTMVCIAFVVGLEIARARGIKLGLAVPDVVDGIVAVVLSGFIVAHLVHVFAYHPDQLSSPSDYDLWGWKFSLPRGVKALTSIWAGVSSMGGFLGAVIGAVVFYKFIRKRSFFEHADAIMYAFPFAWVFGRTGCFLAHDHIGKPTTFFLAVRFRGGPRYDLGLLEALWSIVISAAFWYAGRTPRRPGFFLALWCVLYAPARFGLDFLRNTDLSNADVRWLGLTPAQYGAILMTGLGGYLVYHLSRPGPLGAAPGPSPDPGPAPSQPEAG